MERLITREEFQLLESRDDYFRGRWHYIGPVVEEMRGIRFGPCLELGTNGMRLVRDSDTMDNREYPGLTYLQDAAKPWAQIDDKQYDLFVALQVWEHLNGGQQAAFREVVRTSRAAILSFPFEWDLPEDPVHNGLSHDTFRRWTLGVRPVKSFVVASRAVYVFRFWPERGAD